MNRQQWVSCRVDPPLIENFSRYYQSKNPDDQFQKTVLVHFFDEFGVDIDQEKYAYLTTDEVEDMIDSGKINLDHCYVEKLDIEYKGKLQSFSARHAFFDGGIKINDSKIQCYSVDFCYTIFHNGNCNLVGTILNCDLLMFEYAKFIRSDLDLSFLKLTASILSLQGATSNSNCIDFKFIKCHNTELLFNHAKLADTTITLMQTHFNRGKLSFSKAKIGNVSFYHNFIETFVDCSHADIRSLNFIDCTLNREVLCTGMENLKSLCTSSCINTGSIKIRWHENNLGPAIAANLDSDEGTPAVRYSRAAETALLLKENFRKLGRYEDEDCAYHAYKKYQLRADHLEKQGWRRVAYWPVFVFKKVVFEWLGGYGTRPLNIFVSMPVVMLLFAAAYHAAQSAGWGTIKNLQHAGWWDWQSMTCSAYFSAITFLTIGYGDLSPTSWLIRLLASAEGLLGLLLIAYFTIAFSRKVLR